MNSSESYKDLHTLAAAYASRPDIVQGAGGNFSVKLNEEVMFIKASGREFKDITVDGKGLIPVSFQALKNRIVDGSLERASEQEQLEAIRTSTVGEHAGERPSMETWFHTLLLRYVLHTHSAYVNILSCSEEGSSIFAQLMDKNHIAYATLPYYNPGFELGNALYRVLAAAPSIPHALFLENHGIIVTGDSAESCLALHETIEKGIRQLLAIEHSDFSMSELSPEETQDFDTLTLFPDQAIYPTHPAIRAVHRLIMKHVRQNNFHVRALKQQDIDTLTHMDSEKHRKGLKQY